MSLHRRFLILLAFLSFCTYSVGQGGIIWQEATPICDPTSNSDFTPLPAVEDYDRDINPASIAPCNSYFSFNLNNPAWYTLQATAETISMEISIDNCVGNGHGVGVQYALVEIVDEVPVPLNCNSDANVDSGNTFTTGGLVAGNTYYLVLDGFAESVCEYSISNAVGFDSPDITGRVNQLIVNDQPGINSGCRKDGVVRVSAVDASNNPVENANLYSWEIISIDGGRFSQDFEEMDNSVEIENIPPGEYQAIVNVGNACDSGIEYTLNFIVEENNISILPEETVCLEEFSDEYVPMNPDYRGGPIMGLPNNPTRDTFFIEVGSGECPEIQALPIDFVDGINTANRTVDTTTCDLNGVFINGEQFRPRAIGSLPYLVPLDGDCGGFIELTVTGFALLGDIGFDQCDTKGATLKYDDATNSFEDFRQFASYEWKDASGAVVSTDEVFQVASSGEYSLTITLQQGNNPACVFDIPPVTANVNNLNNLEVECTNVTTGSIGVQWNSIQGFDSYAIAVDGRIIDNDVRDLNFTVDNLNLGDEVNFFVFTNSNDPNCPPLQDSVSCQALDCPTVGLEIFELGTTNVFDSLSFCVDAGGASTMEFEARVTGETATGQGRWIIRGGGVLEGDRNSDRITFNPNDNDAGEYLLGYQYIDGDCETFLDRDLEVYIEVVIPPISTDLDRIGRDEFIDGICVGDPLDFRYNGNAGRGARPIFGGDITNADVTGSLDDRFEVVFATPGTKNFTFMITDDNGCNSDVANYTIEVGEPLLPQVISCDSPPEGLRFDWPDQDCVDEYRIFINGRRQSPDITVSEFVYTRAESGRTYEFEVVAVSACGCGTTDFDVESCPYEPTQLCTNVEVAVTLPEGDSLVCLGSGGVAPIKDLSVLLTGQDAAGVGMWEVDTGSGSISPDGNFDPNVAGIGTHEVKYIWTEGTCVYQDSMSFVITDRSTVSFGIEKIDPICFGENIGTLNVSVDNGIGQDFGVYIDDDPFGSKESSFMIESGDHFVTVIDSLTSCDTIAAVTIMEGPDSLNLFDAGEYFARGNSELRIDLDSLFATTIDSLEWTFNGEIVCEDISCGENFVISPQESGTLCFLGYYGGVCEYMECAEVTYFPEFLIYQPNIISKSAEPNVENQTFQIYTNDPLATIEEMTIFDRWGNVMYQNNSESSSMSWDPRIKPAAAGVYAYFIQVRQSDGKVIPYSGTVTVVE